jgi:hypothetical protein
MCEPTVIFWNLLVMLFGDGSGVPGDSVECCEPQDRVLTIVNSWRSDPFWVGAFAIDMI